MIYTKLSLTNNGGEKWIKIKNSYIKGYAYENNRLLKGDVFYEACINAIRDKNIDNFLLRLNGSFCVVILYATDVYLIVDKIRSYPLHYMRYNGVWYIFDKGYDVIYENVGLRLDKDSEKEILASGYLFGEKTLLKDFFQVVAGHYVVLNKDIKRNVCYHSFVQPKISYRKRDIIGYAQVALEHAFVRMLNSIGEKTIVIPLSGGFDSRLIACLCKKMGKTNVICYTYGRKNSFEVQISKQVANKLGYKWFFIEYTEKMMVDIMNTDGYKNFFRFAGNLSTLPHTQDFFAVYELVERKVINKNCVIVPGHCGDLLGGSKIPLDLFRHKSIRFNKDLLLTLIYDSFYKLNLERYNKRQILLELLNKEVGCVEITTRDQLLDFYECEWIIKARIANFIINSVRVYEYFDIAWRIPLWDDEYAEFWYTVDWEMKRSNKIYNEFMNELYFLPFDVSIPDNKLLNLANSVKNVLPNLIIKLLKSLYIFLKKDSDTDNFNSQDIKARTLKSCMVGDFYECYDTDDCMSLAIIYYMNLFKHDLLLV